MKPDRCGGGGGGEQRERRKEFEVKEEQSERRNVLVKYFEEGASVPCTRSAGDGRDASTHDHLPMCQSATLIDCRRKQSTIVAAVRMSQAPIASDAKRGHQASFVASLSATRRRGVAGRRSSRFASIGLLVK